MTKDPSVYIIKKTNLDNIEQTEENEDEADFEISKKSDLGVSIQLLKCLIIMN